MIARIIKAEVCVICRSRRLRRNVSFEIHLLSFLSNIDEKLSVYIFIIKKEVQVFC